MFLMKIIDSHTHIDYITPNFQHDVKACVCCAVKEFEWQKIIDLMETDNRVYGAFGVHPWFVNSVEKDFDVQLKKLLETNSDYMVGEIGLDKHKPDIEHQIDVFVKQFDIAIKLKRIICLHCVGAWDKILHILKQYKKSEMPIIIAHAFNENEDILNKLLQYENIYFSIGKNALYDRFCRIEEIPLNKILVESDADKNVSLVDVVGAIAKIKNESNIANIIYDNTTKVLKNG